ncbi:MAG: NTP transferase domain-containing protein [Candidatus Bathyarchaeia archaeon]
MRLAAVVLAAGRSERMGRNKLLLEVAGRPILDRLLAALDASTMDEVFVVLGHRPEELRPMVEAHGAEVVVNLAYEEGMTSSFKAGLRRVTADAAFLVLGDQLGLGAELLDRMAREMEADPDALIVSPVHRGRLGHPVLFRRPLFREIMSLGRGMTVRDVVQRHEAAHRLVEGGLWCVLDIDTPDDYERARRLFEAGPGAAP